MLDIAEKFFWPCDEGKGWDYCKEYCHPNATFKTDADTLVHLDRLEDYVEWTRARDTAIQSSLLEATPPVAHSIADIPDPPRGLLSGPLMHCGRFLSSDSPVRDSAPSTGASQSPHPREHSCEPAGAADAPCPSPSSDQILVNPVLIEAERADARALDRGIAHSEINELPDARGANRIAERDPPISHAPVPAPVSCP